MSSPLSREGQATHIADPLGLHGNRRAQPEAQAPGAEGARAPHGSGHSVPKPHHESRPVPLRSWTRLSPRPRSGPQAPAQCHPEVGPLRMALPFRLPSGSVGCAQWGLCGPSSAECQARLRQASRQGGGGPRPQGGDKAGAQALISGLVWSEGWGARTLSPCPLEASHPNASRGLQEPPCGPGSSRRRLQGPLGQSVPAPWWHSTPPAFPKPSAQVRRPSPGPMGEHRARAGVGQAGRESCILGSHA